MSRLSRRQSATLQKTGLLSQTLLSVDGYRIVMLSGHTASTSIPPMRQVPILHLGIKLKTRIKDLENRLVLSTFPSQAPKVVGRAGQPSSKRPPYNIITAVKQAQPFQTLLPSQYFTVTYPALNSFSMSDIADSGSLSAQPHESTTPYWMTQLHNSIIWEDETTVPPWRASNKYCYQLGSRSSQDHSIL
jgi:hypothetical protein